MAGVMCEEMQLGMRVFWIRCNFERYRWCSVGSYSNRGVMVFCFLGPNLFFNFFFSKAKAGRLTNRQLTGRTLWLLTI